MASINLARYQHSLGTDENPIVCDIVRNTDEDAGSLLNKELRTCRLVNGLMTLVQQQGDHRRSNAMFRSVLRE